MDTFPGMKNDISSDTCGQQPMRPEISQSKSADVYEVTSDHNFWHLPGEQPEFYERFGIKQFKKIRSKAGDLDQGFKSDDLTDESDEEKRIRRLAHFAEDTKKSELVHYAGSAAIAANYVWFTAAAGHSVAVDIALGSIQTAVNIYPIMHQRYNRLRIHRLLGKLTSSDVNATHKK